MEHQAGGPPRYTVMSLLNRCGCRETTRWTPWFETKVCWFPDSGNPGLVASRRGCLPETRANQRSRRAHQPACSLVDRHSQGSGALSAEATGIDGINWAEQIPSVVGGRKLSARSAENSFGRPFEHWLDRESGDGLPPGSEVEAWMRHRGLRHWQVLRLWACTTRSGTRGLPPPVNRHGAR